MASGALKDYLGIGLASGRPTTPVLATGVAGYWYATDTGALSVWNGTAWVAVSTGGSLSVKQAGSVVVSAATAINFVSGATVAATGSQADITVAGGGSTKWTLLNSWDFAVSGAISQLDTTGITNDEVMVVGQGVTKSVSGRPLIYVSTNNGVSYDTTSSNYLFLNSSGGTAGNSGFYLDNGITTAATSGELILTAMQETGSKFVIFSTANAPGYQYVGSTSIINAMRVIPSAGGTFSGGKIFVYGRH